LNGGGDDVSIGVDDEAELSETYEAMEALGVEKDTVNNIMQLLSGLLHLGNLEFEERIVDSTDGSQVKNKEVR
jgi:myosin heavy subunit